MSQKTLPQQNTSVREQLADAIATLSKSSESVAQEQFLAAINILSSPKVPLTQDLLLVVIAALLNPKEQLDDLMAVVKEMFATIAWLTKPEPDILRLDQVSTFIDWVKGRLKLRKLGKAIGETGLGKTFACYACLEEFEPIQWQPNHSPEIPLIYIQVDINRCSPGRVLQLILIALKKPTSGNINQLKQRVKKFLKQYRVRAILVDEAHCLSFDALKTVRDLHDDKELKVIPILIGTSNRLDSLIEKDEQVRDRYSNTFMFEELSSDKFNKILTIWGERIIRMQDPLSSKNDSNATSKKRVIPLLKHGRQGIDKDLASSLEEITSRELRLLDDILRDAAVRLLEKKLKEIYDLALQSLRTESRIMNLDVKKILRQTRIDKPFIQSIKGEYVREGL